MNRSEMSTTPFKHLAAPLVLLIAVCLTGPLTGCGGLLPDIGLVPPGQSAPTASNAAAAESGLGVVRVRDLPPEARTTLQLIESNGPYPYAKDGTTFHNYEGLLPKRPDGYYREYTVVTPGASERGARRIVAGDKGERYYTDDHYNSFRLVAE